MQFKTLVFATIQVLAVVALDLRADPQPQVFTGTKVFHTIVDTSPFMIETTSLFTWTQTPTATPTA